MTDKIIDYTDLKAWQRSMDLVERVYLFTETMPRKELYRLTDQLCRSVISVPSNIAEGSSRRSTKEYIRFVNIAYASLMECETQLRIACKLKYMTSQMLTDMIEETRVIARMLNALLTALKKKLVPSSLSPNPKY